MLLHPDAGNPGLTGAGGTPVLPIAGTPLATFDTTIQGFLIDDYLDSMQTNIANQTWLMDEAASPRRRWSFEPADGDPDPGCLKVVAPFN